MKVFEQMKNPPKKYRAMPFWSWNDQLEIIELTRQINEMHQAGLGGYFMHARGGLKTPYLGEDWMNCIESCILEGNKHSMGSWCYDENGWPSGFGNGAVTDLGLDYHQKQLKFEKLDAKGFEKKDQTIGLYVYDESLDAYKNIIDHGVVTGEILHIYYEVNPYYVDVLNKDVISTFIESTYEVYYQKMSEHFGKGMEGVFTDEPQYGRGGIPWSFILEDEFSKRYGYSLSDVLPNLFMKGDGYKKNRYDFWHMVTDLFVTSFSQQIGDWCDQHNCQFTGHVVSEESLLSQVMSVGDAMAFYEYMHIPGMDWLGRDINNAIVPRQVSSVAHQLGKKQAITETFGDSGWNVSLEEMKWIAQWQYVHGINLMCPHLSGYSLKGLRKRDYPPSLHYQQPWWPDYNQFNDHFARLGMLMSEGTNIVDVLVIHPMRTAWVTYDSQNHREVGTYDRQFEALSEMLCQMGHNYDYGSETILKKHGDVVEGDFKVGVSQYKTVVIPPSVVLTETTIVLLEKFLSSGGRVIAFDRFPTLMDGRESDRLHNIKKSSKILPFEWHSVKEALDQSGARLFADIKGSDDQNKIFYSVKDLEGKKLYYFVNLDKDQEKQMDVGLLDQGKVEMIDLDTGEIKAVNARATTEGMLLSLTFVPAGSYLICVTPGEVSDSSEKLEKVLTQVTEQETDQQWHIEKSDYNALTLDTCKLKVEDEGWGPEIPIILLQDQLLDYKRPVDILMAFTFEADFDGDKNRTLFLVMEEPDKFQIKINGTEVSYSDDGWWIDTSFKKLDISPYIVKGSNEILLSTHYYNSPETYKQIEKAKIFEGEGNKLTYDTELESIYIIGDFAVDAKEGYQAGERRTQNNDGPFRLIEGQPYVRTGDLVEQGYPFFTGSITLTQDITVEENPLTYDSVMLELEQPDAIVTKVWINDNLVKSFLWAPYEVDVKHYLKKGNNSIQLELISSNRNLLGPHHHISGELYMAGPTSFTDKKSWIDGDLEAEHIYTDRYCFVRFGLASDLRIKFYKTKFQEEI